MLLQTCKRNIGITFLKFLLNYGLILFCAMTFHGNTISANDDHSSPTQYRLPDTIIPLHYNISLILNDIAKTEKVIHSFNNKITIAETAFTFSGSTKIRIMVEKNNTVELQFNLIPSQVIITDCYLYAEILSVRIKCELLPMKYKNEIFTVRLNNYYILPGIYILEIWFYCIIPDHARGMYRTSISNEHGDTVWLFATHFLPIGARGLFPCWDEPKFRATFEIYIQHYKKYTVLSNVPHVSTFNITKEIVVERFTTRSWIMSPHELTIVVLDFPIKFRLHETSHVTVWYRENFPQVQFAHQIAENIEIFVFTKKDFIVKMNHVAIPGFPHDAMDYAGLILYRESAIIYDPELDPPAQKLEIAGLIINIMALQLSVRPVSPSWWSDLWLSDGIKVLSGIHLMNKILQPFECDLFLFKIRHESLHLDTYSFMKPLMSEVNSPSEIESLCPFSRHIKASTILRMLEYVLTEKVFWKGVELYFFKYKYETASVPDFFNALQTALDVSKEKKFRITLFMDPWIKNNHLPILKAELILDFPVPTLVIKTNETPENYLIPVTYTTQAELDFCMIEHPQWLNPPHQFIQEKLQNINYAADFYLLNLQRRGYYRVNYDITNWRRIANYLINGTYQKIHVLNRAQLIDDAFHLMMLNQLDVNMFVHLTTYLKREQNYLAWYPMFKALEYMSTFFLFPESNDFKKHMGEIFHSVLDQIGYEEKSDHDVQTNFLREEAAKWACVLSEIGCKANATVKLKALLDRMNKVPAWWKHWVYSHGMCNLMTSDIMMLHFSENLSDDDQVEEYMSYLCPEHIPTYFSMIKSKRLQSIDPVKSYLLTVSKHGNDKAVLRYILNNFNILKPKKISLIAAIIVIINHIYNEEQLIMIAAFLDVPLWERKHEQDTCNKLFDQEVLFLEKVLQRAQTFFMKITMPSRHKIEKRLSQIEHQKNQFVMFMKANSNIHA